jgi:hypothetical protein
METHIDQKNNKLNTSTFRSNFKLWFKSRYRTTEDEERLTNFIDHLDKLSVLLNLDIYSIGLDNLLKLSLLSEGIFDECQSLKAGNNRNHIYSLNTLIYYKVYENRPKLFQDYSDHLNIDSKNLRSSSALTYTTEAQTMAEQFSQSVFKKELNEAIVEESDFIESLVQYIDNRENKITFKGITHFEAYLKRIKMRNI